MKTTKQNALSKLRLFEDKLPYGAKAKLARKLRQNRHNVQTAFRGMASEKLTIKVYEKALKMFPDETRTLREKKKAIRA